MQRNRRTPRRTPRSRKGTALVTTFGVLTLMALAAGSYVQSSTQTLRQAQHAVMEVRATQLCEAGLNAVQRELWRPFRASQRFTEIAQATTGASPGNERVVRSGEIGGVGNFVAGVTGYTQVNPYLAVVNIRTVGFIDRNNNDLLDPGEASKEVHSVARFELARSQVFDYTYFVNNYGWMDGFREGDLIVNGDMRANGNFDFLNGSPTINGTVIAAANDKLVPPAAGLINTPPVKWNDTTYNNNWNNAATPHRDRWRPAYNPSIHGAIGTADFERWRDLVHFSNAQWVAGRDVNGTYVAPGSFGSVLADATGTSAWTRTSTGQVATRTVLDTRPTQEVVMPDLSDLARYQELSRNFSTDPANYQKANFGDGTANPNYGQPAYVEIWNSTLGRYDRISDANGRVAGSAVLIGTTTNPIRIYGPVTVDQDVVIKGNVTGQGTFYAGRNVHVVGSVRYSNPPNFRGSNPAALEQQNEKRDMLGLAARGSVIMGDPTRFSSPYPLAYMTPPFTKGRFDDNGVFIPPYNALERDATGRMRYQSVVPDATIRAIAEGVNQIDAILYTNFVGGGNVGTGGGGMTLNGTLVSKDEAIVAWSVPIRLNYDNRVRERGPDVPPLIDLNLPRQPTLMRSTWQDRGFSPGY